MKNFLTIALLAINLSPVAARSNSNKNAFTVGFLMGPAAIKTEYRLPYPYYNNNNYGPTEEPSFCIAFTAEQYFNPSHHKLYFSLGGRMSTTYFSTPYYNYLPYYYPGTPYPYINYQGDDHMLIGSLGVSTCLNWDIVQGRKATLTTQLAAVPMVEAGNFKNDFQPNAAGELFVGGTFASKISVGVRASHRLMTYEYDYGPYDGNRYRVTHIAVDLRFRINAPAKK